jgi:hypothetical protein
MRFLKLYLTLFLGSVLFLLSCSENRSEYESMVKEGLDSGRVVNDIFLGYELGMTRKEFLDYSWDLNQKEIVTGGTKVIYLLEELKSTVRLEFFPEIKNNVVTKMPVSASYISWSPWNEQYNADELLNDMRLYYEETYNTTFRNFELPENDQIVWISIEGNREIRMYKKSVNTIQINFIDLSQADQNS